MDDDLDKFEPDFSSEEDDVCPLGGGHEYAESMNDGKTQVLECMKCGHLSVGWYA